MFGKNFIRVFGSLLLVSSVVLFVYSIGPLINWFSLYGFIIEFEMPIVYFTISILFLPLGLIYSFLPKEKISKSLKTSAILALLVILINVGYFGLLQIVEQNTKMDMLGFGIMYIVLFFPASLIAFVVSLIFAFIALFKKVKYN